MEKEEFQKKYNNSIIMYDNDTQIGGVFNICDLMDLTCYKSAKRYGVIIGIMKIKSPLFHVEQFISDFYKMMEEKKNQSKEPTFKKGNRIMYTIEDENGNTHAVTRLSERVYESKEHHTLFITDEEGIVTGIYKEE